MTIHAIASMSRQLLMTSPPKEKGRTEARPKGVEENKHAVALRTFG